jgi:predicted RNA-binding protein with PIN domain
MTTKMPQLLLDGYNVIYKIPQLQSHLNHSLEDARQALANFMITWARTHHNKASISIIFDGRDGIINSSQSLCGIKSIYTKTKQEADDKIISIVRNSQAKQDITVISDDNYVTNNCKAHGAQVKSTAFLLQPKAQGSAQDDKPIDSKTEHEINEWLKKEYGLK